MAMASPGMSPIFNGDTIILYCAESAGHIYCEPRSSPSTPITVHSQRSDLPAQFPNVHFAVFRITHVKPTSFKSVMASEVDLEDDNGVNKDGMGDYDLMTAVACGSTVKLQHVATKKYISIRPSTPAWLSEGRDDSIFRLLPGRHGKSWGEDVFCGDSLRLESIHHKGQRIQCVYNPLTSRYNLVLAVTGSIIAARPHCPMYSTVKLHTIRGGDVVSLKWRKIEGYLSLKGSFVSDTLPEELRIKSSAGLRRWREHQRGTSTSADTYFQIEKQSNPSSGESLSFGEFCRIKHLSTQKYLTSKTSMKNHSILPGNSVPNDGNDVFRLLPIDRNNLSKPITSQDQVLFVNVSTGRVLSVNSHRNLQRELSNQQDPLSQWFNLKLDTYYEDDQSKNHPFTIRKVEDDGVTDIYYVIGLASLLSRCVIKVTSTDFRESDEDNVLKNFRKEIEEQMRLMVSKLQSTFNTKRLANMLRIMQVIDAMLVMLAFIGTNTEVGHSVASAICLALKEYAKCANKKSRARIADKKFLNTLISLVGKNVDVEGVLVALVKDDNEMSQSLKAQMSITDMKIDNPQVLELLRFLGFNSKVEVRNKMLEKTQQECNVESFECKNDINVALEAFIDQTVQEQAQHRFVIQRENFTFDYGALSTMIECRYDDTFGNLGKMEYRIRNFLKHNKLHYLYGDQMFQGRNGIIFEMLEAVYFLCERNVYVNNEHLDVIVKHLFEILDGNTDSLSPDSRFNKGSDRFSAVKVPGNVHVFKVKTQVVKIIRCLLNQHLKGTLKHVLWDFKYIYLKQRERVYSNAALRDIPEEVAQQLEDNGSIEDDEELTQFNAEEDGHYLGIEEPVESPRLRKLRAKSREEIELGLISEYVDLDMDEEEPPEILRELLEENADITTNNLTRTAQRRLRVLYRKRLSPRFDTDMADTTCKILLDLLEYEDGDLQLECAELLFDLFSVETKILNEAEKSYFITPYSNSEKQRQMIAVGTMTDPEQLLGKMLKMQSGDIPKLIKTLRMFGDWCVDEADETKPDVVIQGVAYSSGLFSIVLEYVLEYGPSDHFDQEDILSSCFYLLQRIARGNPRVQKELFKYFHDLMGTKVGVSSMTLLLNEIFAYNGAICEKLTDYDIQQLFYTLVASSNPEHFELSLTLRAIIENATAATSLQETISQLIVDYWQDNLGYLLGSDNQDTRFNLLKQDSDFEPELVLLLNISDLLATCTEGECRFAEEVSRSFFSLDELIKIVLDGDIPVHRKLPFARLITWTHLNTERDSLVSCIQLAECSELWAHVESLNNDIDNIVKLIATLKPNEKKIIELKLRSLDKLYLSVNGWMEMSKSLNELEDSDGTEFSSDLNGLLIYILKGIIPFLSAFCSEFALHLNGSSDACNVNIQIPVLIEIGKSLAGFHRTKVLVSSGHLHGIKSCLSDMKKFFTIKGITDQHAINTAISSFTNQTLERRNRVFSQENILFASENPEKQLNDAFQLYVENYRRAYEELSDTTVFDEMLLSLPRGPSFKKLVNLFTDSNDVLRNPVKTLKVEKLLKLIETLIRKQRRQGVQSVVKPKLEAVTLFTLQLLFCVVDEQIKRVHKEEPAIFRKQYAELVFPLQQRLLEKGAPELLIGILQNAREDVAFQVLACLNVLLYSGNEEAQKKITELIREESRGIFVRVHQILNTAQTSLTQAKMSKVLNQLAASTYNPEEDDRMAIKILKRNKSAAILSSLSIAEEEDPDPNNSLVSFSSRRRTAVGRVGSNSDLAGRLSSSPHLIPSIQPSAIGKGLAPVSPVDHRIAVALNLLSWLCDGQKRNMQDVLREQKLFASSSIVSQVSFLFHGIVENLKEENIQIAQCAVQSMIEMCAGNFENQELAFKGQVVVSIDQILPENFTSHSAQEALLKLKCSCFELLEVMVEETSLQSPQLGKWIFSHLDLNNFLFAMKELWEEYTSLFHITSKEYLQRSMFRAFHVLRRIADYKDGTVDQLVGYTEEKSCRFTKIFGDGIGEARAMWRRCHFWSNSIEVIYTTNTKEKILTRAYFYFDPHKHLNENEKETVILRIKRNTPEEKLTDLLYWTKAVREYHSWKESIKKHPIGRWIIQAATIRHFFLYWLTIFLNLLILFSFSAPSSYDPERGSCDADNNDTNCLFFQPIFKPQAPDWYFILNYVVGSIHLFLSIWMVIQHILKNWKIFTFKIPSVTLLMYKLRKGILRRRYFYRVARLLNRYLCCGKITANHPLSDKYFETSFFSFEPIYRILFTLFSFLGLAVSGYFYCGCMLYIFLKNSVLQYILKAVGKSALQLLTVFVLGLVITYIYAVISFALASNYFNPENDQFCQTLFQCFITITRIGLLDTLGPGVSVRPYDNYDPNFRVVGLRTIYDLVFFIVVTVLGLNIIVAILVDRFSKLREDKERIKDDNNSRCLICSIPKDAFESKGLDFVKHFKQDHYAWNYIHYALYLDSIHENDHNALEKHIFEQIPSGKKKAGSIDFYPLRKAKALPNYEESPSAAATE